MTAPPAPLELKHVKIESGLVSDLLDIARFQLDMALETKNEKPDFETVCKGISYIFQRNAKIETDTGSPFYLIARHAVPSPDSFCAS